jgi:HK97 family phage major capsid protein
MNTAARRRTAIELPAAISRRRQVFAMAEPANDIAALGRQFGDFNSAVTERIGAVENSLDKVMERIASLVVHGGGGAPSGEANLRAELNAVASYFRSRGRQQEELHNINSNAIAALAGVQGIDPAKIRATMSVGSDPDGGYVVLPEISRTMTKKLWDVSPMRRISRVESIVGTEWKEPIDADQITSGWVGEQDSRPQTGTPKLGMLDISLNESYCMPPITQALLDSASFDLGSWLVGKINDKFARDEGAAFVAGDGVARPMGFLSVPQSTATDATRPWGTIQTVSTGVSGDFPASNPADVLKTLVWSLRTPYRAGATWLMNSNTLSRVDKFKDGQGNYLLRPGLTSGMPDMLLGYPVAVDDVAMPDIGANACAIAFGNFQLGYVIIDGIGIRLLVDPYSAKPYVLYYAYRRVGGGVANSEAIKLLKFA